MKTKRTVLRDLQWTTQTYLYIEINFTLIQFIFCQLSNFLPQYISGSAKSMILCVRPIVGRLSIWAKIIWLNICSHIGDNFTRIWSGRRYCGIVVRILYFSPFSPISWYPSLILSHCSNSPTGSGDETVESRVLQNKTRKTAPPSLTPAHLTWKTAAPMCPPQGVTRAQ